MSDITIIMLFILLVVLLVSLVYCSRQSSQKVESFVAIQGEDSEGIDDEDDDDSDGDEDSDESGEDDEEEEEEGAKNGGDDGHGGGSSNSEDEMDEHHDPTNPPGKPTSHPFNPSDEDESISIEDEVLDTGKGLFTNNSFARLSSGNHDIHDFQGQPFPGLKNTGNIVQVGNGNPGTSQFVLKLGYQQSYSIPNIKLKSGQKYVVKLWERHSYQSKKNRVSDGVGKNFFQIDYHKGQSAQKLTGLGSIRSQGMRKETTVINDYTWNSLDFIFTTPKGVQMADFSIQNDNTDKDFVIDITNLGLFVYINPIELFPLYHKIAFYQSTLLASSFRPKNGRMWLDQTDGGKDFLFSHTPKYDRREVDLFNDIKKTPLTIIGPPSHDLHIFFDHGFSLGWTGQFEHNPGNYIFFYTHLVNNGKEQNLTLSINMKQDRSQSELTLKIGQNTLTWNVGRVDEPSAYLLGFDTTSNKVSLYKETQDRYHSKTIPSQKQSHIGNMISRQMQFTNIPLIINPKQNGNLKGTLYQFYGYHESFPDDMANKINHFMYRRCCEHSPQEEEEEHIYHEEHHTLPPSQAPLVPPTTTPSQAPGIPDSPDEPVPFEEAEGGHAHYSHHQSSGSGGGYQNQNVEVIISGDLTRGKDVANAQKTIQSLVKAFNAREKDDDESNPAEKVEYHVRPDGKVVRRVYRRKQVPGEEINTCQL